MILNTVIRILTQNIIMILYCGQLSPNKISVVQICLTYSNSVHSNEVSQWSGLNATAVLMAPLHFSSYSFVRRYPSQTCYSSTSTRPMTTRLGSLVKVRARYLHNRLRISNSTLKLQMSLMLIYATTTSVCSFHKA